MRKLMLIITAICALSAYAENGKEVKTYVVNDNLVYYCNYNGITVIVNPNIRGLFEPVITILNDSGDEFLFNPQEIKAYAYAMPYQKNKAVRYRLGRFFRQGGEIDELVKDPLTLYTFKEYRKKYSSNLRWQSVLSESIYATMGGMVSGTIGDIGRQRDIYYALTMRDLQNNNQEIRRSELQTIDQGFWRSNTIFPDSESYGFIAIKPVKSDQVLLEIPVNGEVFEFFINMAKR